MNNFFTVLPSSHSTINVDYNVHCRVEAGRACKEIIQWLIRPPVQYLEQEEGSGKELILKLEPSPRLGLPPSTQNIKYSSNLLHRPAHLPPYNTHIVIFIHWLIPPPVQYFGTRKRIGQRIYKKNLEPSPHLGLSPSTQNIKYNSDPHRPAHLPPYNTHSNLHSLANPSSCSAF